ncbi:MAG: single-stranded DNA-binding protein [Candidatus Hodarchaeales archaeon]
MSYETEVTEVKISDLRPYQNRFKVIFKVIEKTEPREVSNRNNPDETHRLSDITVADETASIILTVWDDDIELMEEGNYYSLVNGFINVFRDSMRLARGKYGNFESAEAEFDVNLSTNRSDEVHERRQRRRDYDNKRSNYNRNESFNSSYRRW